MLSAVVVPPAAAPTGAPRVSPRAGGRERNVPFMYGEDVLAGNWRKRRTIPEVDASPDLVVEDADSGFCGAVVGFELGAVVLEDGRGRRRNFPLAPAAFLLEGKPVTLRRPAAAAPSQPRRRVTASGSVAVDGVRAQVETRFA